MKAPNDYGYLNVYVRESPYDYPFKKNTISICLLQSSSIFHFFFVLQLVFDHSFIHQQEVILEI